MQTTKPITAANWITGSASMKIGIVPYVSVTIVDRNRTRLISIILLFVLKMRDAPISYSGILNIIQFPAAVSVINHLLGHTSIYADILASDEAGLVAA